MASSADSRVGDDIWGDTKEEFHKAQALTQHAWEEIEKAYNENRLEQKDISIYEDSQRELLLVALNNFKISLVNDPTCNLNLLRQAFKNLALYLHHIPKEEFSILIEVVYRTQKFLLRDIEKNYQFLANFVNSNLLPFSTKYRKIIAGIAVALGGLLILASILSIVASCGASLPLTTITTSIGITAINGGFTTGGMATVIGSGIIGTASTALGACSLWRKNVCGRNYSAEVAEALKQSKLLRISNLNDKNSPHTPSPTDTDAATAAVATPSERRY